MFLISGRPSDVATNRNAGYGNQSVDGGANDNADYSGFGAQLEARVDELKENY